MGSVNAVIGAGGAPKVDPAEAQRRAEEARQKAEAARLAAEARRKAATEARDNLTQAKHDADAARRQKTAAEKAVTNARKAADRPGQTPAEAKKSKEALADAEKKLKEASDASRAAAQKLQDAEEKAALAAKSAEEAMHKANAAAVAESKTPPYSQKDIDRVKPTKNELDSAFEGTSRRTKLEKLLGLTPPPPQEVIQSTGTGEAPGTPFDAVGTKDAQDAKATAMATEGHETYDAFVPEARSRPPVQQAAAIAPRPVTDAKGLGRPNNQKPTDARGVSRKTETLSGAKSSVPPRPPAVTEYYKLKNQGPPQRSDFPEGGLGTKDYNDSTREYHQTLNAASSKASSYFLQQTKDDLLKTPIGRALQKEAERVGVKLHVLSDSEYQKRYPDTGAVTLNKDIYFPISSVDPANEDGIDIYTHELAHVALGEAVGKEGDSLDSRIGRTREHFQRIGLNPADGERLARETFEWNDSISRSHVFTSTVGRDLDRERKGLPRESDAIRNKLYKLTAERELGLSISRQLDATEKPITQRDAEALWAASPQGRARPLKGQELLDFFAEIQSEWYVESQLV
ncbi:eCIS core domain-containing protein [Corallococcus exiguus]|uniref:DUF4157 domain-containing protein n=1 Tax=Corallococcus exiguus TaxID=83462 RepID=A0A7X5BUN2_9BACT|nr:DUF4157 domain-containing protein [Corallococcus exiguus]NBC41372.1 DUF4157 domain-containing protein [Corallococcus exiguus]TNV66984.1 DUF4157 domain-containing protein [Corallococcus exiguus]